MAHEPKPKNYLQRWTREHLHKVPNRLDRDAFPNPTDNEAYTILARALRRQAVREQLIDAIDAEVSTFIAQNPTFPQLGQKP